MDMSWLSPLAEANPAGEKGWGSFATVDIPAGTTVAAFGGFVTSGEVLATFDDVRQSRSIQIDDDLFLVSSESPEPGDMLNHSCEPTCGLMGSAMLVTMRDVAAGEEPAAGDGARRHGERVVDGRGIGDPLHGGAPAGRGGGGGAPSAWFLAALLLLGIARRFGRR